MLVWLPPGIHVLTRDGDRGDGSHKSSIILPGDGRVLANDAHVRVAYVTHMYDLAHGFYREHIPNALFLRAERLPNGERTFRLAEGEPLPTSFGQDLYRQIFAAGGNPNSAMGGSRQADRQTRYR